MNLIRNIYAGLLAITIATPLQADSLDGSNIDQIMTILRGFGSISQTKAQDGSPRLTGRMDGTAYGVYFYGCDDNKVLCHEIQMSAGWSNAPISLNQISIWNRDKRYCKAYSDRAGDTMIEMDINIRFGVSRKNLEDSMEFWQMCLKEFSKILHK